MGEGSVCTWSTADSESEVSADGDASRDALSGRREHGDPSQRSESSCGRWRVTVSALPPLLHAAVEEVNEMTRILSWGLILLDLDPAVNGLLTELDEARAHILGAWQRGDISETEAAVELRHAVQRFVFRLKTFGNARLE